MAGCRLRTHATGLVGAACVIALLHSPMGAMPTAMAQSYTVISYNDLGMHCMNEDFSEIAILPPYNNLRAQVIRRGGEPELIREGVTIRYSILGGARASDKTNFWKYANAMFGVTLPPNVGLAGKGLVGTMDSRGEPDDFWEAVGIPATPSDDMGRLNPYPIAEVVVYRQGQEVARTQTVVPVSQELSCSLCHNEPGVSMETDMLRDHDRLHGTDLESQKPVVCASCHADVALGAPGVAGVSAFSHAMHTAHASRVDVLALDNKCYACHPGVRTQCLRDVHLANGVDCTDCHGDMAAVGNPSRQPWLEEPRCGDCHSRPGFDFEQPGKLFKESHGHGGVMCITCHGSPHAITPAVTSVDDAQAIRLQGHAGPINDCLVCHTSQPSESFFHSLDD